MEANFHSHYFRVKVTFNATVNTVARVKPPLLPEHPNKESCFRCSNIIMLLKFSWTVSEEGDVRAIKFSLLDKKYPPPPAHSFNNTITMDFSLYKWKLQTG